MGETMNLNLPSSFSQPSGPVLCAVIDVQDFNIVILQAINHNIGQAGEDQLSGSFFPSGASAIGRGT
jgi:hypothetical protein